MDITDARNNEYQNVPVPAGAVPHVVVADFST
jgi:hypothetical protein